MITLEEAEKIAFSKASGMNVCDEYEEAFHFFNPDEEKDGGNGDIVVMKEDGRTKTFVQFLLNHHPEANPRRIEIELIEDCGGIKPTLPHGLVHKCGGIKDDTPPFPKNSEASTDK